MSDTPKRPATGIEREFYSVGLMRLEPGDIVVITANQTLTMQERDSWLADLGDVFPNNRLLLIEFAEVAVVRPDPETSPAVSAKDYHEPDPKQRIQNALDETDGKGGPFTKHQQQDKVQEQGDQAASHS